MVTERRERLPAGIKIIGQHEIDLAQFIEAGAGSRQLIGKIKDRVSVFFSLRVRLFFPDNQGIDEDIYSPLLKAIKWQKGGGQ